MKQKYTVSEFIDSYGLNKITWTTFLLLAIANIFDGYDFMVVNSSNSYLAASFNIIGNTSAIGSLTTWGLLGMVVGGALGGVLSDQFGRKKMLIISCLIYGLFTFPQAFVNSIELFAIFRLIAGFGVGSCLPVVTTTFSEVVPTKNRAVFVTFGMAFMVMGWVISGLICAPICNFQNSIIPGLTDNTITLSTGESVYENWRVCYLIGAIPIIYAITLKFNMLETASWYVSKGLMKDAYNTLTIFYNASKYGINITKLSEKNIIKPISLPKTKPNLLFSKKYIIATAAVWTTYFIGQFCVYGMNAWIPAWFQSVGYSTQDSINLQTWNNVAAIASNVSVGFVSELIGRKKNLAISWLACIVVVVLCSVFIIADPEQARFGLYIILMLLFGFALNYTITAIQPLMPESYPTYLRNTGVSWCQAFARFGGSASSIVLGSIAAMAFFRYVDGTANWNLIILVLIIPFVLGFACTILFVRETKGKTLDELSENNKKNSLKSLDSGKLPFTIICVISLILFILCVVCPLIIPDWAKLSIALPLMAIALLLPFVFFFVFGGKQLLENKKESNE